MSSTTKFTFPRSILATCSILAILSVSVDAQTSRENKKSDGKPAARQEEKKRKSADEMAVSKAMKSLTKAIDRNDFAAASKLMTADAFDELCVMKIQESAMLVQQGFVNPKAAMKIERVFKQYGLKRDDLPAPKFGEAPSRKKRIAQNAKILKPLDGLAKRTEAMDALTKASANALPGDMMMIEVSPFSGDIETIEPTEDGTISVEIKMSMPEGMMAGPNGALPAEIAEIDFPGGIPENAQFIMGDLPSTFVRFRKQGKTWKCDGIDIEKTEAAFAQADFGLDIPTIENPKFDGTTLSGKELELKDYRGKLVLIDFWGTWCKPCVAELPTLKKLYKVLKPHGLEILGIANDQKASLNKLTKTLPLPWENIVDEGGKICQKYGVHVFPTTLLIDQKGNHVASNLMGPRLVEELTERLELDDETAKTVQEIILNSQSKIQDAVEKKVQVE